MDLLSQSPDRWSGNGLKPHQFLRTATRTWHERVEAAFAPFDLQAIDGLANFLKRQAAAHLPLERELDDQGMERLLPDWAERRRSAALLADLSHLGVTPDLPPLNVSLPTREHLFGALYVLEGSRLGGRLLHRQVVSSPHPLVRSATAYFDHPGSREGWGGFVRALNETPMSRKHSGNLLAGAEQAFELFHRAAA